MPSKAITATFNLRVAIFERDIASHPLRHRADLQQRLRTLRRLRAGLEQRFRLHTCGSELAWGADFECRRRRAGLRRRFRARRRRRAGLRRRFRVRRRLRAGLERQFRVQAAPSRLEAAISSAQAAPSKPEAATSSAQAAPSSLEAVISSAQAALSRPCLLYTSPSPRDYAASRMPSSA